MEVLILGCHKVNANRLSLWGITEHGKRSFDVLVPTRISIGIESTGSDKVMSLLKAMSVPLSTSVSLASRYTVVSEYPIDQVIGDIPSYSLAKKTRDTIRQVTDSYKFYPFVQLDDREPEERIFLYSNVYPLSIFSIPETDGVWCMDLRFKRNFMWPELPGYTHLIQESVDDNGIEDPIVQLISKCKMEIPDSTTVTELHSNWLNGVMIEEDKNIARGLTLLSYDIETHTYNGTTECRMIGITYSDMLNINDKKKYLLTFPNITKITIDKCTVIMLNTEEEMLIEFKKLLDLLDPSVTIGYNTIAFDNVILRDRMNYYRISPIEAYNVGDHCYWMRKNSLHIDVLLVIRQLGISSDNSLDTISKLLLGHGKIGSRVDSMQNIFDSIKNGNRKDGWKLRGIAKYCVVDTELVHELITLYPLMLFISKITSVLHCFIQSLMYSNRSRLMESWYNSELTMRDITYLPDTSIPVPSSLSYKETMFCSESLLNIIRKRIPLSMNGTTIDNIIDSIGEYTIPVEPNVLCPSSWNSGKFISDRVACMVIRSVFTAGLGNMNSFTSFSKRVIGMTKG